MTAATKHTPGPWKFKKFTSDEAELELLKKHGMKPVRMLLNDGAIPIMGPNGRRIGTVDCQTPYKRGKGHETDCEERDANAALFAAAPDLLATAQRVLAALDRMPSNPADGLADELRAVIARAGGA